MSMLHEITALAGAHKRSKRKGRGDSSGKGKTAGRGTKGAGARSGKYIRHGYEGGQTEIYRRLPKRGFSNFAFTTRYHVVNLGDLAEKFADGATVDHEALVEAGLVKGTDLGVKVLGNGELNGRKLTVRAARYSASAVEKLQAAGGAAQDALGEPYAEPAAPSKAKMKPKGERGAVAAPKPE